MNPAASPPEPAATTGSNAQGVWQVNGDRARVLPVASSTSLYKGIPQMAYLWAYFTADAHRRAE